MPESVSRPTDPLRPVAILLVEDNPDDVQLTLRGFRKAHVSNQIIVARDGEQAVSYLERCLVEASCPLPGLILLDLRLPRLSGHEVLQRIKAEPQLARIPVIVLTASSRDEDIVRSYELGVNTFITKPVGFVDFMRVVATIQDYWITIATLPPAAIPVEA